MKAIVKQTTLCLYIALLIKLTTSLKHHLVLTDDHRISFSVSSFGYQLGGRLEVIVQNLTLSPDPSELMLTEPQFGLVLIKLDPYLKNPFQLDKEDFRKMTCMLNDPRHYANHGLLTLSVDPNSEKVLVRCVGDNKLPSITTLPYNLRRDLNISHGSYKHVYNKRAAGHLFSPASNTTDRSLSIASDISDVPEMMKKNYDKYEIHKCPNSQDLPLIIHNDDMGRRSYAFNFTMFVGHERDEGLYCLTFHNCRGESSHYNPTAMTPTRFNLSMLIYETNYPENYLSAGVMPLPQMYFVLSVMFFLIGCIWVNFIARQKESALKIHYLMTVLVFAKACSLLFHGINYHYIALDGQPVVTWAYLYYATRAVKGALFFITLGLIGSGWSFIKYMLSDKDKKIILVVVTLQIIAHIAEIVLDESTEGEASNAFWALLCSVVDLFSCVAIIYPITWSIKHLEEASRTDGKAAINLKKLELFKRFYIISASYIYVTRLVTFVFLSLFSYKYSWLVELVSEFTTLIYFIVTGYYFQPLPTNPYLLLSSDNNQEEDILFSLDSHEMEASQRHDDTKGADKETLLEQKVTRRHAEEIV